MTDTIHGDILTSAQLNVRTSDTLIEELDRVISSGMFRNRTEAVNEAIRLLIRRYKVMKIAENIDAIAKENTGKGTITDALSAIREEEDQ